MPPSYINYNKILRLFYPKYKPHPVDIGHLHMYNLLHNNALYDRLYKSPISFQRYMDEMIDECCILYEQLVHDWSEYERFLESELPFMKWEKSTRLF